MTTDNAATDNGAKRGRSALDRERIAEFAARYGIILAFFVLCGVLAVVSPYFLTWGNILNVLRQTSINGILAIGMTFVILTRGIDLSVGSMAAFAGIVGASFASGSDAMPVIVAITMGLCAGLSLGAVNGFMIARFAIPPFVMTLGMLSMARGLTYIYNDGMPISNLSEAYSFIGQGVVMGIPMPVILFLGVFLLAWATLKFTTFGRYVYAVGGNPKAAKTSGIRVKLVIFSVYAISGVLCGLGGLLLSARTSAALPQAGVAYELDAIAAVVIGGTSLSGGVGTVLGTLIGALIIGVMNNGLDLLGVSSFYQQLVKGAIIVLAVMLDRSRHARE